MTPEGREFTQTLKLAAVAVVCAVLTATLVIGAGEALLRQSRSAGSTPPLLTQAAN
ncbi:hypothetical protein [Brevundimonas sp. TSRC1-1]|uniref:hypothetical protein n=1 Tax=Brevundimonas sp. TSRC1-1 TaxID=2804562 RepID=UPI003CE7D517